MWGSYLLWLVRVSNHVFDAGSGVMESTPSIKNNTESSSIIWCFSFRGSNCGVAATSQPMSVGCFYQGVTVFPHPPFSDSFAEEIKTKYEKKLHFVTVSSWMEANSSLSLWSLLASPFALHPLWQHTPITEAHCCCGCSLSSFVLEKTDALFSEWDDAFILGLLTWATLTQVSFTHAPSLLTTHTSL